MSLFSQLLAITTFFMIISAVLYVIFGQITVRKLRKNPETRHELGIEFVSGWDILNVARALTIPQFINQKFRNSPLSAFYANTELLYRHTNRFDRFLAKLFYILLVLSGSAGILLLLLNYFGVFS